MKIKDYVTAQASLRTGCKGAYYEQWSADPRPVRSMGAALVVWRHGKDDVLDIIDRHCTAERLPRPTLLGDTYNRFDPQAKTAQNQVLLVQTAVKLAAGELYKEWVTKVAAESEQSSYELTGLKNYNYARVPDWVHDKEGFLMVVNIFNKGS